MKVAIGCDPNASELKKRRIVREGIDVNIISTGSTTKAAIEATDNLSEVGISVRV